MELTRLSSARSAALAVVTALLVAGCSGGVASRPVSSTSPGAATSAVDRWRQDYDYLAARTKPVEIACTYVRSDNHGHVAATPRRGWFLSFSQVAAVRSLFITPFDPSGAQPKRSRPDGPFRKCVANIPTSVPYRTAAINRFLAHHGLIYGVDTAHAHGLTPTDIVYAGRGRFRTYRDKPGLFALALALVPQSLGGGRAMQPGIARDVYAPGTDAIIPPTTERQASIYQWFTDLLVHWYRSGKGY